LYLAAGDRRTPWYAKALALCTAAYALSPVDLIPDFVPVLGYLDDLIIVPAGIALTIRLIPAEVLEEAREKAKQARGPGRGLVLVGLAIVVFMWVVILIGIVRLIKFSS